jgi:methylated-DNA-protein-cysteine methyltransferase-like protein
MKTNETQSSFFDNVYAVVRLIPKGRVTSYGAIARYLGASRSARMVGWAMNNAHALLPPIAAHRVVNSAGLLTGKAHFGSPDRMQQLLEKEGIKIKNNQVQSLEKVFWDPMKELEL